MASKTYAPLDVAEMSAVWNPAASRRLLYPKGDGYWYSRSPAGAETRLAYDAGATPPNLPVGSIIAWTATAPPVGFLPCDGAAVSRAAYPELFAQLGTKYGAGDGSTTFNVPNLVGRLPMGNYPSGAYANGLGVTGGESAHLLTAAELPNLQVYSGDGYRIYSGLGSGLSGYYLNNANNNGALSGGPFNSAYAWGGGGSHNVLNPYTTVAYIIRATPSSGVDSSTVQFFKGAVPPATAVTFTGGANMPFAQRTDPANAWNATTNLYVVPQPGRYRITVMVKGDGGAVIKSLKLMKNGAAVAWGADSPTSAFSGSALVDVLDLVAGDTIAIRPVFTFTSCGSDGAGVENTYLIIETVGLAGAPTGQADSGWVNLPYANGWRDYGGSWEPGRYRKLNGVVYLQGLISSGTVTSQTTMATVPAGFRPAGDKHYPVASAAAYGQINVFADGRITTNAPLSNAWVSLANVSWIADN